MILLPVSKTPDYAIRNQFIAQKDKDVGGYPGKSLPLYNHIITTYRRSPKYSVLPMLYSNILMHHSWF